MGVRYGLFCLGCCWLLMLLLFIGGVMNLIWVAGIALYVLTEKFAPHGPKLSRGTGALLVLWAPPRWPGASPVHKAKGELP